MWLSERPVLAREAAFVSDTLPVNVHPRVHHLSCPWVVNGRATAPVMVGLCCGNDGLYAAGTTPCTDLPLRTLCCGNDALHRPAIAHELKFPQQASALALRG